jgi:hypothetical protein
MGFWKENLIEMRVIRMKWYWELTPLVPLQENEVILRTDSTGPQVPVQENVRCFTHEYLAKNCVDISVFELGPSIETYNLLDWLTLLP